MFPPTSSPTTTPITARVLAMRNPENSGGSVVGNSTMRNTCQRVAENDRAKLIRSPSMARMADSTLISTGKNTINTATKIFG